MRWVAGFNRSHMTLKRKRLTDLILPMMLWGTVKAIDVWFAF